MPATSTTTVVTVFPRLLRHLIVGIAYLCLAANPSAGEMPESHFVINEPQLAPALIRFSQQSGLSIAFSKRLARNIEAPYVVGTMSHGQALDTLLQDSGLSWELVQDHIIAIYALDCSANNSCPSPEETLEKYPIYEPGIGETYVYASRVTGSRIKRTGHESTAPVQILSAPDIELSGAQTLGELLKFVPAVSGNAISTAISNGGDGTSSVTLRGLPASNTLVLINGRRVANNGLAGESVDLNSIPPAAVERIEILKDGASAIYGSDAVAGVVNVIMRRDYSGFLAETYYGEAEAGDLQTQTHTLQYGTRLPRGSLFISASVFEQDPIYSRDRKVSQSADTRPLGGSDQRSSASPDSRVVLPDGSTLIADGASYRPFTDSDLYDFSPFTTAVVPLERDSIYTNLEYDLTSSVTALLELSHLETEATAELAPTPIFTAFEQQPIVVSKDNRFNTFGVDLSDVRRRVLELPRRQQHNKSEASRMTISLEGEAFDWYWDFGYNWSRSEASERTLNLVNADNLARGLGPSVNCQGIEVDGCVPVNLLGAQGTLSQDQADYIRVDGEVSGYSKLSSINGSISGAAFDLPQGRVDVAVGIEYRSESTSKKPEGMLGSISTIGGTNFEATRGQRDVAEVFAETVIPVWGNAKGDYTLDLEAALRYSDYSDFGSTTNPKAGFRLQLGKSFAVRGNYAEGFRAPSLNELFAGNTEEQAFLNDPCTQIQNVGVLVGCSQQADPTRNQFLTIRGGNSDLKPETAETWSAGVVWTPVEIEGLTISADIFQIEQENVVSASAQFLVGQNARTGAFEDQVERDELGNLTLISATNINAGRRRVQGADLALSYFLPPAQWGQLSFTGAAAYIGEYLTRLDSSAPELDLSGTFRDEASEGLGGIPEWKAQLGLRWKKKRWRGSYDMHYVSSMQEVIPDSMLTRNIDSWLIHDLQLSYTFNVLKGLRTSLGVDNALDKEAPLATSAFNDNIDGRTHELKGRFWYVKLSQRF
ncbi:MAG: TonB-dependent receptor [Halioglobus sp.]